MNATGARVLISIAYGYEFDRMLAESFEALGWQEDIALFYERGTRPGWRKYPNRVTARWRGPAATFQREKEICLAEILRKVEETRPSLVLVIRGEWVDRPAVEAIRRLSPGVRIVVWMYDPIEMFSSGLDAALLADRFYLYDTVDIETLHRVHGIAPQRLDLGYSERRFFEMPGSEPTIDVSMTGAFSPASYGKRIKVATALGRLSKKHGFSLKIAGPLWTKGDPAAWALRRRIGREHPGFLDVFHNVRLTYEAQNDIYNRSKINVNTHRNESAGSCNTRVFEILGAGGFQLCDGNPIVEEHFSTGEHLDIYRNVSELEEKILYYLRHENERRKVARQGSALTRAEHRFQDRVRAILSSLEIKPPKDV